MEEVTTHPNLWHLVPWLVSVDINGVDVVSLDGVHILLMTLHKVDHLVVHLWKIRRRPGNNLS